MSSWHCFVEERAEQMLRRGAAALVLIAPRMRAIRSGRSTYSSSASPGCALVTDPWRARLEDKFLGSDRFRVDRLHEH